MSLLEFEQSQSSVSGLYAHQADPDWSTDEPKLTDGLITNQLQTDEGNGNWLMFDLENNLWGGVVRSNESPYNDCLPPVESFLESAFFEQNTADDILGALHDEVESSFLNPFELVLGDLSTGTLHRFVGSFQAQSSTIEPGCYRLTDSTTIEPLSSSPFVTSSETDPLTQLKTIVSQNKFTNHFSAHLENDGMRELSSLTLFHFDDENCHLLYQEPPIAPEEWQTTEWTTAQMS